VSTGDLYLGILGWYSWSPI